MVVTWIYVLLLCHTFGILLDSTTLTGTQYKYLTRSLYINTTMDHPGSLRLLILVEFVFVLNHNHTTITIA